MIGTDDKANFFLVWRVAFHKVTYPNETTSPTKKRVLGNKDTWVDGKNLTLRDFVEWSLVWRKVCIKWHYNESGGGFLSIQMYYPFKKQECKLQFS
jgi:hypothetical protein